MSFANHNILDIALSILPSTVVQIRKTLGTTINKYGQAEAVYSEWIDVYGMVQPGGEQNEHTQGIDFSKKFVTIWLRGIALDGTHIQWAPDQILYIGKVFNVVSVKDWFPYDNFRECECVEAVNLGETKRNQEQPSKRKRKSATKVGKKEAPKEEIEEVQPNQITSSTEQTAHSLVGKAIIKF